MEKYVEFPAKTAAQWAGFAVAVVVVIAAVRMIPGLPRAIKP